MTLNVYVLPGVRPSTTTGDDEPTPTMPPGLLRTSKYDTTTATSPSLSPPATAAAAAGAPGPPPPSLLPGVNSTVAESRPTKGVPMIVGGGGGGGGVDGGDTLAETLPGTVGVEGEDVQAGASLLQSRASLPLQDPMPSPICSLSENGSPRRNRPSMSRADRGWSSGTMCPEFKTIRNVNGVPAFSYLCGRQTEDPYAGSRASWVDV